jgi:protein-tyrosine phosphatase
MIPGDGLDDGAATIEESLAMLAIAEQSGTTDIVATPHANSEYLFNPGLIAERIAELQPRTSMRIHPGCDFHLHVSNIEDALQHPEKFTINHGNYLLVEFQEISRFRAAGEISGGCSRRGVAHIVASDAHPES